MSNQAILLQIRIQATTKTNMIKLITLLFTMFCMVMIAPMTAHADSPKITIGISDRLATKSQNFSMNLYSVFAEESGFTVEFIVQPMTRTDRALNEGRIDIKLYMDDILGEKLARSKHPIGLVKLQAIGLSDMSSNKSELFSAPDTVIAWARGDSLSESMGYQGKVMEVDSFRQGIRLVEAGRISAFVEWNTEIAARCEELGITIDHLKQTTILDNVPLFPIAIKGTKGANYLVQFDRWLEKKHAEGKLIHHYEAFGFTHAYPF